MNKKFNLAPARSYISNSIPIWILRKISVSIIIFHLCYFTSATHIWVAKLKHMLYLESHKHMEFGRWNHPDEARSASEKNGIATMRKQILFGRVFVKIRLNASNGGGLWPRCAATILATHFAVCVCVVFVHAEGDEPKDIGKWKRLKLIRVFRK